MHNDNEMSQLIHHPIDAITTTTVRSRTAQKLVIHDRSYAPTFTPVGSSSHNNTTFDPDKTFVTCHYANTDVNSRTSTVQFYYTVETTKPTNSVLVDGQLSTYLSQAMIESISARLCPKDASEVNNMTTTVTTDTMEATSCILSVGSGPDDVPLGSCDTTLEESKSCQLYNGSIHVTHTSECDGDLMNGVTIQTLEDVVNSPPFLRTVNTHIKRYIRRHGQDDMNNNSISSNTSSNPQDRLNSTDENQDIQDIGGDNSNEALRVTNVDLVDLPMSNNTVAAIGGEVNQSNKQEGITTAAIVLLVLLGLLLCFLMFFLQRFLRKRNRQKEQTSVKQVSNADPVVGVGSVQTEASPDDDENTNINDSYEVDDSKDDLQLRPDYKNLAMKHSGVDVHTCRSAVCLICNKNRNIGAVTMVSVNRQESKIRSIPTLTFTSTSLDADNNDEDDDSSTALSQPKIDHYHIDDDSDADTLDRLATQTSYGPSTLPSSTSPVMPRTQTNNSLGSSSGSSRTSYVDNFLTEKVGITEPSQTVMTEQVDKDHHGATVHSVSIFPRSKSSMSHPFDEVDEVSMEGSTMSAQRKSRWDWARPRDKKDATKT